MRRSTSTSLVGRRCLPSGTAAIMTASRQRGRLSRLVDARQALGRYTLTHKDFASLELSPSAVSASVQRLVLAGRLAKVGYRRGVWLIVPIEYRTMGAPPATWVLDDIMHAIGVPYYLALRSAAEQYGATHYAMQRLQVAVARRLKPMQIGGQRVRFVLNHRLTTVPTNMLAGQVASFRCSTPDATALDLMRFMTISGGLTSVAGALQQMRPRLTVEGLRQALAAMVDVRNTQRLGYLFTQIGYDRGAAVCRAWLAQRSYRIVPLEHGVHAATTAHAAVDPVWKVAINAVPDLSL